MLNRKISVCILLIILISLNFVGCDSIDNLKTKFGGKNEYFEYLNTAKSDKISIQSIRDPGFKFIVTDPKAIKDMYELLSSAKIADKKAELDPDYIFEINVGDEVKKFYYVVGAYEGNFYDGNTNFTVSKRLDEGIIQNLSIIRKPRDFEYVYYRSILDVLEMKKSGLNNGEYKIGINIQGDIDCLKYVFSTDLKDFLKNARKINPNVDLVKNNSNEFDVVITIKNRGYNNTTYKTNITFENKKDKIKEEFYVMATNEFKEWAIDIYEEENLPKAIKAEW
ncbi:hypothetical protein [Clostridium septicum]|uniref:YhfM-like domain-containing protein n=1 Tax=Clostridium septicum TaxID=1504 RepID=A0A9N7JMM0_CLOSE|nr:hypothetical protein [Clostridium septicum]AYE34432.1 hypothetical protein CP523_08325 [Clostridium septicum]QAS59835.1 hypothetical protein EI377_03070 [Clostridium septicum]UEC22234.1 hypothetical protein LK444_00435 [Clostridium septicum]USS02415.1 hypothetical protein NH397_00660 [Clostridium septicum]WLF71022.1 hypothetical protein Q6375_00670 [Clostridium septicum]